jgi:hypothetical protein
MSTGNSKEAEENSLCVQEEEEWVKKKASQDLPY